MSDPNRYRRSGEYRNCLHCHKEFYCRPSFVKNPKRGKYCSNACQHKFRIAKGIKLSSVFLHHCKPAKPKYCKGCGGVVEVKGRVYCSDECRVQKAKDRCSFSAQRDKMKSAGVKHFVWMEPCNVCQEKDQVYYVCATNKTCKKCHNKRVYKNKKSDKNYKKYRKKFNAWRNKKRSEDPAFKIHENIRSRVYYMIKQIKTYRTGSIENMFGCGRDHLIKHFESMFTAKMTWENYGSYWHVDHIIPISLFDLTDPEQCKTANHWTNLQPLEASKNIAKSNTITQPQTSLMLNA
jgi:hypothetical protein